MILPGRKLLIRLCWGAGTNVFVCCTMSTSVGKLWGGHGQAGNSQHGECRAVAPDKKEQWVKCRNPCCASFLCLHRMLRSYFMSCGIPCSLWNCLDTGICFWITSLCGLNLCRDWVQELQEETKCSQHQHAFGASMKSRLPNAESPKFSSIL